MATLTAGEVRPCCASGAHMRIVAETTQLVTRQCVAPHDGGIVVDGVAVCGRMHYRARLVGLNTRARGIGLGAA